MSLEDLLTQSATVRPLALGQSAAGGATRTPGVPIAEGVPCLVSVKSASLDAFAGRRDDARRESLAATVFFAGDPLAPDASLSTRHQLEIAGAVYAILGAVDPNSMGRLLQVAVERIR